MSLPHEHTLAPTTFPHHSVSTSDIGIRRITQEKYEFEGWAVTVLKSPILPSQCYCAQGTLTVTKHSSITSTVHGTQHGHGVHSPPGTVCQVCRFSSSLSLHHLPEMVFPDNVLRLVYEPSSFSIEFNALDAMKLVSTTAVPTVHVAWSNEWMAQRVLSGIPVGEAIAPYDWTYSTDYKGSVNFLNSESTQPSVTVDTTSKLNLEKLRQQETILFYEEIPLYEDELHDNGISNLSVKLRIMPSGFFILLRYFLRVDQVFVRFCDTRIHFETGNTFIIRQMQIREEKYENLSHLQPQIFTDPNGLYAYLPLILELNERISLKPGT